MKKAVCTWGEAKDVVISLENDAFILFEDPDKSHFVHGTVTKGQMDLSAAEAEQLAGELLIAAREARRLEAMCQQHDDAAEQLASELLTAARETRRLEARRQQHDDAVMEADGLDLAWYEIKALKRLPAALELLCDYHAVNEAEAEAVDMPGPMKFHEKRRKEIEAVIERLKKQQG
jgi:hypothetical protein